MGARLAKIVAGRLGRIALGAAALGCVGAAAVSHSADTGGVQRVSFGGDRRETRVIIEIDRSARARAVSQENGVLTLALPAATISGEREGQGQGLVRSWTMDRAGGSARLKLALAGKVKVTRRFLLPPADGSPNYRYVVDLAASGPLAAAPARITEPSRPTMVSATERASRSQKVVVIDAGHGGKDPGAQGVEIYEKDVTLQAALMLRDRLEKNDRYRVVLTRSNDAFVPLETRVQIARRADADLFISLHADAGTDPSLRGASVYTLSDQGSSRAARKAIGERGYFIDVGLPGRDAAVNQILLDLTQRTTRSRSSTFAETLVHRVADKRDMLRRSHRSAGYIVLLAPDVPAVLLEMGFITNPGDEAFLTDSRTRGRLMEAVAGSIDDYFAADRKFASR
jgi:N-acetylmuramoyl-L-alanine amidase